MFPPPSSSESHDTINDASQDMTEAPPTPSHTTTTERGMAASTLPPGARGASFGLMISPCANRIALLIIALVAMFAGDTTHAARDLEEIKLDYAYYSPASLVIKRFGWLEHALADDDIRVRWVLSQGS